MTSQSIYFPPLATVLWPESSSTKNLIRNIALAVFGVVLLTLSSKIKIPFYPVPVTMQTFAVLALGIVYGSRLGASTILLYLTVGVMGIPVFAGAGAGFAVIAGPTGGYLIGFVIAAAVTGYLAEKGWDRKVVLTFVAMLIGNIIIYIPGLIWLANVLGWDKPILEWGLYPFIVGDLAKIVLAMLVIPMAWNIVKKTR